MKAVSTSGTSVNFYQTTWRNVPEESYIDTLHHENLKSKQLIFANQHKSFSLQIAAQ
jgi:hypothetical protein